MTTTSVADARRREEAEEIDEEPGEDRLEQLARQEEKGTDSSLHKGEQ